MSVGTPDHVLVVGDAVAAEAIALALDGGMVERGPRGFVVTIVPRFEAVLPRLEAEAADAVVLIADGDAPAVEARVSAVTARAPEAAVLVVTPRPDDDLGLRVIRAGGQEVVDASEDQLDRVAGALRRAILRHRRLRRVDDHARHRRILLDEVDAAVIATDLEGRLTFWNRGAERLYGWSRDEALGRPVVEVTVAADGGTDAREIMAEVGRTGRWHGEFGVQRADGSVFPSWVSLALTYDGRGQPDGIVGVSYDLTQRRRTEDELAKRERLRSSMLAVYTAFAEGSTDRAAEHVLEAAFATIPMASTGSVLIRTTAGTYRFAAVRGYDRDALAAIEIPPEFVLFGRDWTDGRPFIVDAIVALNASQADQHEDIRRLSAVTAQVEPVQALVAPVVIDGELVAAISIEHGHTGRTFPPDAPALLARFASGIAALLHRLASDERGSLLARAIDAADDGLAIVDLPTPPAAERGDRPRVLEANAAFARLVGIPLDRVRRWEMDEVLERPANLPLVRALEEGLEQGPNVRVEAPLERPDGTLGWLDVTVTRIVETERRMRYLVTLRDVTLRHRQTKQLLALNAELGSRLKEARTLEAIDAAITGGRSVADVLTAIVTQVRAQAGVAEACILAASVDGDVLLPVAGTGFMATVEAPSVPLGRGPAGRAAAARAPVEVHGHDQILAAFEEEARVPAAMYGAYVAWPLVTQGVVVGVLETYLEPDFKATGEWRQFMQRIAGQAAIAVDSGSMVDRLRRAAAEYAELAAFSSRIEEVDDPDELVDLGVRTLMREFGMNAAAYFERRGDEILLVKRWGVIPEYYGEVIARPGRVGHGATGLAITRGESVYVEDYRTWEGSIPALRDGQLSTLLSLPVGTDGGADHVITIMSFDRRASLRREQIAVARAFVRRLERALERVAHLAEIVATREEAFRALGLALEYRDYETKGHTDRVVALARRFGRRLGLDDDALEALSWGAYLHDIGKIAVADTIVRTPEQLTDHEMEQLKRHTTFGFHMTQDLAFLPQATREVVRSHHERWDGTGYPDGLSAEAIPYLARVFALVDVYDALVSERPYKGPWSHHEAVAELERLAGSHFDPELVRVLVALFEDEGPPAA